MVRGDVVLVGGLGDSRALDGFRDGDDRLFAAQRSGLAGRAFGVAVGEPGSEILGKGEHDPVFTSPVWR